MGDMDVPTFMYLRADQPNKDTGRVDKNWPALSGKSSGDKSPQAKQRVLVEDLKAQRVDLNATPRRMYPCADKPHTLFKSTPAS